VCYLVPSGMRLLYSSHLVSLNLPINHRFPIHKYRIIYEQLRADCAPWLVPAVVAHDDELALIHGDEYIHAVASGGLSKQAVRRLGFPWSPELNQRARTSVGGTLSALVWAVHHGAAGHLAGGTHHSFADRGEGYCVFNDLAIAAVFAQQTYGFIRIAIIDLDVHQGNGTAALFQDNETVFTLSVHGRRNYPFRKERSTLDVELEDNCTDSPYLRALENALSVVEQYQPQLILYQAGVDSLAGDQLGRLALTHHGLQQRNDLVYRLAKQLGVPLVVTLGGGYHRDTTQSIRAHVDVFQQLMAAF
jgi:acetoin utilization deacetylase AcuC-like enzyme